MPELAGPPEGCALARMRGQIAQNVTQGEPLAPGSPEECSAVLGGTSCKAAVCIVSGRSTNPFEGFNPNFTTQVTTEHGMKPPCADNFTRAAFLRHVGWPENMRSIRSKGDD